MLDAAIELEKTGRTLKHLTANTRVAILNIEGNLVPAAGMRDSGLECGAG
jgi:hypothetical protein